MDKIKFLVQGSAADPYEVTFFRPDINKLAATCSCPAGEVGQTCKHRLAILGGDMKAVVSGSQKEQKLVEEWFSGSSLQTAMAELISLEKEMAKIKSAISAQKKRIAKTMLEF